MSELRHHEQITDPAFRRAVDLMDAGNVGALKTWLDDHLGLITARTKLGDGTYFSNPSLLAFVAENPIRHGVLSPAAIDVTQLIIDLGADQNAIDETLGLVSSGRIARESGLQAEMIHLLCSAGGDPNGAMRPAIAHGEFEAATALINAGAEKTLPWAAAAGDFQTASKLADASSSTQRHEAIALAAQFGNHSIVRMLLAKGEDPNRYNPDGCHAHTTPLHQAAYAGHLDVVRELLKAGARTDIPDKIHGGTAIRWAHHNNQTQVMAVLEAQAG